MWTRRFVVGIVILVCMSMIGCTQSQVITDIEIALRAAQVAIPIVAGAAGLSAARVAEILSWIQSALKALGSVSDRLSAGGPSAQIAAGITEDLAAVVAAQPDLAGLPASIATVVQALAADLQNVLATYGTKSLLAARSTSPLGTKVRYGRADRLRLTEFKARDVTAMAAVDLALAAHR